MSAAAAHHGSTGNGKSALRPETRDSAHREGKAVSIAPESRPNTREQHLGGGGGGGAGDLTPPQTVAQLWDAACANCIGFIFPPTMKRSQKALVRLSAYAKYGPAAEDADGQLRLRGSQRLLQHHEEQLLLAEEERALTYEVYGAACVTIAGRRAKIEPGGVRAVTSTVAPNTNSAALDDTAFGEMATKKHPLMWDLLELTRAELEAVLAAVKLPTAEKDGGALKRTTVADAISNALLIERERRIRVLKGSDPRLEQLRTDTDVTKKQATRFYNRTFPKAFEIRNWEDPRDVLRALHRSAFQIVEYSERNRPDVNYNVRCLRPDYRIGPGDNVKEGWDNFSTVRRSHSGKATTLRR